MAKEDFTFFWGGAFSQWYPSPMEIDGVQYNCAEQYMMEQKAKLFGDEEMRQKIMTTDSPNKQKQFGKQVKGFDKDTWENVAKDIVKRANIAKFTQNPELMVAFEVSKGRELVEASPEDKIWGIGLHESDELAWNKETWQGTNWLGEAIMRVRDTLKVEKAFV